MVQAALPMKEYESIAQGHGRAVSKLIIIFALLSSLICFQGPAMQAVCTVPLPISLLCLACLSDVFPLS